MAGLIVFPDSYTHPSGVTALTNINTMSAAFTTNVFDAADWTKIEKAGAVFLPTGSRDGTKVEDIDTGGYYWSSRCKITADAFRMYFNSGQVICTTSLDRKYGLSIRLVADVN